MIVAFPGHLLYCFGCSLKLAHTRRVQTLFTRIYKEAMWIKRLAQGYATMAVQMNARGEK